MYTDTHKYKKSDKRGKTLKKTEKTDSVKREMACLLVLVFH